LVYPGLRFDFLVVVIPAFAPDRYTCTTLFLCPDQECPIIFCFS
jgi:hypothetical protein